MLPLNGPCLKKAEVLPVSIHLNRSTYKDVLSPEGSQFLKTFPTIGCRDFWTRDLLKKQGIEAYYSACLTLTIQNRNEKRDGGIVFCDPAGKSTEATRWHREKDDYTQKILEKIYKKFSGKKITLHRTRNYSQRST